MKKYIFNRYFKGNLCASKTIITRAKDIDDAKHIAKEINHFDPELTFELEIIEEYDSFNMEVL